MKADGFIERAWQEHLNRVGGPKCSEDDYSDLVANFEEGAYSLGLREMAGVYVINAFLMLVALVIAYLKRETKRQLSKRSNQHFNSKNSDNKMEASPPSDEAKKETKSDYGGSPRSEDTRVEDLNSHLKLNQRRGFDLCQMRSYP